MIPVAGIGDGTLYSYRIPPEGIAILVLATPEALALDYQSESEEDDMVRLGQYWLALSGTAGHGPLRRPPRLMPRRWGNGPVRVLTFEGADWFKYLLGCLDLA